MEMLVEDFKELDVRFDYKPVDDIGRTRAYIRSVVSIEQYLIICKKLDSEIDDENCSRWTVRGIVNNCPAAEIISEKLSTDTFVEINALPIIHDGVNQTFLWVSRNSKSRVVTGGTRKEFSDNLQKHISFQQDYALRFNSSSSELFDMAKKNEWSLVCNDPFSEWGENKISKTEFFSFLKSYFYVDEKTAELMLQGRGYSTYNHYLFGLKDKSGELLGVFVLAKWPWGFEGTYTMVKPSKKIGRGVAKILMLASNALLVSRYGNDHLIYGEANTANCRPCIQAGYEIVPPDLKSGMPNYQRNIIWADNPIGNYKGEDDIKHDMSPPNHKDSQYASYALMKLDNNKVKKFVKDSFQLLTK